MKDIRWNLFKSKKLLGIGFMVDTCPLNREKWIQAEFKLLFVAGWIVIYKTKER